MVHLRVLALADDTTGALEAGARFGGCGVRCEVRLYPFCGTAPLLSSTHALVLDTQSRHCTADEAKVRVKGALLSAGGDAPGALVFKKTDSTLRGNIAEELGAMLSLLPDRPVVYAPAYPEMGRSVREGRLYIHGRPVEESEFGADALNPVRCGNLRTLLAGVGVGTRLIRKVQELEDALGSADAGTILVCDGAASGDLEQTARTIARSERAVIAAGTAAFGGAWARALPMEREEPPELPRALRGLIVSGSRHPMTASQIRAAEALRIPVCCEASMAITGIGRRGWAVLAPRPGSQGAAEEIAVRLASEARKVFDAAALEAVAVFGGDTAYALLRMLDCARVVACREILPGVPASLLQNSRPMVLVTKAGGFGGPEIIREILAKLGD
ncbi:MAG TPA: four-carbon acid sugar kinase family protein [Bryobacteraceae bacterium]|nr:four-carbon acid sugar kinase family protein [Bryobacteraceae bacterium]